jgi:hypothetical protein
MLLHRCAACKYTNFTPKKEAANGNPSFYFRFTSNSSSFGTCLLIQQAFDISFISSAA